jgi:hypothetical protein
MKDRENNWMKNPRELKVIKLHSPTTGAVRGAIQLHPGGRIRGGRQELYKL